MADRENDRDAGVLAELEPETSTGPESANGLTRAVFALLESSATADSELPARLRELEDEHGEETYAQLLSLLCHLRFEPRRAKEHWLAVLDHRATLEEKWEAPVDLRVALASYFMHVERQLENPTLIEMRLFERTQAYAYRDELTGLRNYRFFELYLMHELHRSDQYSWPLSLILLDLDDFKAYNDRHGHMAGNEALAAVGQRVAECCRRVDVSARFGGEEFAVILPETPKLGAERVAERMRVAVEGQTLSHGSLTVSLGVATYPADAHSAEGFIQSADKAMYLAKSRGKNQVARFGDSRRSHRRVRVELVGELLGPERHWNRFKTVDASEGGFRFVSDVEPEVGSLIDIRLEVPGVDDQLTVAGRVIKSDPEAGRFVTSARVIEMSSRDRHQLTEHLHQVAARRLEVSE